MSGLRLFLSIGLCMFAACVDTAIVHLFAVDSGVCHADGCRDASRQTARRDSAVGHLDAAVDAAGCRPLAERVVVGFPELPVPAVPSNEYNPMLLAARSDGSSLLGYRQAGAQRLRVLSLGSDGQVLGEVFQTEGQEAHALLAHQGGGGALVYMREDPDIYSAQYCRGRDTPDLPICGSMQLERFDGNGQVTMAATLTDKVNVATDDSSFIYWFQHTARLAWADNTYAVYYRSARNHPAMGAELVSTDTLRFIDADGQRLQRGWTFGCYYSWSVRLAYNGVWAAACHSDRMPNGHRVVIYDDDVRREMTFLPGVAPVDRALGGLVPAGNGFWLSYLRRQDDGLQLHLARLSTAPEFDMDLVISQAQDIDSEYVFRAYLAVYGEDRLLVGWKSREQLVLAVVDGRSGAALEGPVVIDGPIDNLVEFVSYPGGDVGWAHADSTGQVSVTRVQACEP